jgi:hypothetical protein
MRSERCQQIAPRLVLPAQDLARLVESGTSTVQGLQDHAAAARETRRALQVRGRAVGVRSVLPMMIWFYSFFHAAWNRASGGIRGVQRIRVTAWIP